MRLLSTIACGALLSIPTVAMATDLAPLDVPAKALPAPTADISPGMQAFVGAPLNPNWNKLWKTGEEARAFDGHAIDANVPSLLLMENAGRGAADAIVEGCTKRGKKAGARIAITLATLLAFVHSAASDARIEMCALNFLASFVSLTAGRACMPTA